MPAIHRAISGLTFNVYDVDASDNSAHMHNLSDMLTEYNGLVLKIARAKSATEWLVNTAQRLAGQAAEYGAFFGVPVPVFPPISEETLKAAKERAAKASKEKAERTKQRNAERAAAELQRKNEWLAGENNYFRTNRGDYTYMRIKGENVETSQGADFPIEHAKKAFTIIRRMKENGVTWAKTAMTQEQAEKCAIRLGHYQVDEIDAQGNVRAGCHYVEWPEIERIARALNIYP
jgi:hypothetical protein